MSSRQWVVTSFPPGAPYRVRCVDSMLRCWPFLMSLYADPGDWLTVRERLPETNPEAEKPTNYIWNARRYSVKPFIWLDAALRLGKGIVVWLDGDTVTVDPVPASLPADMLGDADVAYLGRGAMHPETGCVVFRVPESLLLLEWCRDAYRDGTFRSLTDGWTDCHVLRAGIQATDVHARDLTSHLVDGWRSTHDAFALSPLGPYVRHYKGSQRKRELACAS